MGLLDGFFKKNQTTTETKSVTTESGNFVDQFNFNIIEGIKPIETSYRDYVLYGHSNCVPKELLELRNSSGLHNAIIESKSRLIAGEDIIFGEEEESKDWLVKNFMRVPFWRKLHKNFYLIARDQQTFGYSFIEVIYSVDHTKIVDINWIDATRMACGKKNEKTGKIDHYYYCQNWSNTQAYKPIKIDAYDPNNNSARQVMMICNQTNDMDYFSIPGYFSAIKWVKADSMMGDYNMNAIKNGFSPSIIFKFYKKPSPEERRLNAEMIKQQFGGTKNAGKAMIFYADGKELAPDVDTVDATNIDQRLIQVSDQIIAQIVSGHRINPVLCGINIPGKLGLSNETEQAWTLFNALVITPERKMILDAFRDILLYNGISDFKIKDLIMDQSLVDEKTTEEDVDTISGPIKE